MYREIKIKILFMICTVLLACFASCSTIPVTASATTPLNDRAYADFGRTDGADSAWSLFGLWMFGRPDMDEAITEALAKKEGSEALVNVTMRQSTIYFFFFSIDKVIIEGNAVKFYIEEGAPENEIINE